MNVLNALYTGIILGMVSANEKRRYIETSPLIGLDYTQKNPCICL